MFKEYVNSMLKGDFNKNAPQRPLKHSSYLLVGRKAFVKNSVH